MPVVAFFAHNTAPVVLLQCQRNTSSGEVIPSVIENKENKRTQPSPEKPPSERADHRWQPILALFVSDVACRVCLIPHSPLLHLCAVGFERVWSTASPIPVAIDLTDPVSLVLLTICVVQGPLKASRSKTVRTHTTEADTRSVYNPKGSHLPGAPRQRLPSTPHFLLWPSHATPIISLTPYNSTYQSPTGVATEQSTASQPSDSILAAPTWTKTLAPPRLGTTVLRLVPYPPTRNPAFTSVSGYASTFLQYHVSSALTILFSSPPGREKPHNRKKGQDVNALVALQQLYFDVIRSWRDLSPELIREAARTFHLVASELAERTEARFAGGDLLQLRRTRTLFVQTWLQVPIESQSSVERAPDEEEQEEVSGYSTPSTYQSPPPDSPSDDQPYGNLADSDPERTLVD
ncbi:hypothetical protein P7C70_g7469, partial [Phenoliferia sp. Uapishka_3]